MYSHTFFVTSVRARVFAPQIVANASLSFLGAKMPFLAFFMTNAFLLPAALLVVFFVVVVGTAVFVVVVIAIEG